MAVECQQRVDVRQTAAVVHMKMALERADMQHAVYCKDKMDASLRRTSRERAGKQNEWMSGGCGSWFQDGYWK